MTVKDKIIIFYSEGNEFKATIPWDSTVSEVMQAFIGALVAAGYQKESVDNWIVEKAEEIE